MPHQASRRVGPPIPLERNQNGFLVPAALVWIIAGIAYMTAAFWLFVYEHRPNESPVNFRDEQYDPNL